MSYLKNKDKILKALNIIQNNNNLVKAREFGMIYFKNHKILTRHSNIGNGATKGVGAWFKAGHILKGLKDDKLIDYDFGTSKITLTSKGISYLTEK